LFPINGLLIAYRTMRWTIVDAMSVLTRALYM